MRAVMRLCAACVGVACTGVALAGPQVDAQAQYTRAAKLDDDGDFQGALAAIDQGLAGASTPKDKELKLKLLGLKGTVLLKLRDYPGALAAYQAYLDAGACCRNRREAQKIVDMLGTV